MTVRGSMARTRCRWSPAPGSGAMNSDYALRFHLHPSVKASRLSDARGVMLVLPNRDVWTFEALDDKVELEDSVFLAGNDGPRRTAQIVIRQDSRHASSIRWSFVRSTASPSATHRQTQRPPRTGIAALGVARHCEPTGRANARPMTGSAKQLSFALSHDGLLRRSAPRNDDKYDVVLLRSVPLKEKTWPMQQSAAKAAAPLIPVRCFAMTLFRLPAEPRRRSPACSEFHGNIFTTSCRKESRLPGYRGSARQAVRRRRGNLDPNAGLLRYLACGANRRCPSHPDHPGKGRLVPGELPL